MTSVCTGSLVLGAAGLLHGRRATTHWASHELLAAFGATPMHERVARDGNLLTGGVTAGIDFVLTLFAELVSPLAAQVVQLELEYAPAPPFAGTPDTAPAEASRIAREQSAPGLAVRRKIIARIVGG